MAAETSIGLAKSLLSGYSGLPAGGNADASQPRKNFDNRPSTRDLPGIVGKFDGENLIGEDRKSYPVPTNYAGKSKLVCGDTLKMMSNPDGSRLFKQIDKVARKALEAKLTKKEGHWFAKTADESYRVLDTNVEFLRGQEGDATTVLVPEHDLKVTFAAIDTIPVRDAERQSRYQNAPVTAKPVLLAKEIKAEPKVEKVEKKEVKEPEKEAEKEDKPKRGGRRPSGHVEETEKAEPEKKVAAKETKKEATAAPVKPAVVDDDELR